MAYSLLDEIENHKGLIKVKQLATWIGVSPKAVYAMINEGKIPRLILPTGAIRFDPKTLSFWLRKHNPILNQVKKAA